LDGTSPNSNVGRILAPTNSPQLAEFMAALDEINARAEATPGFIWRLQSDSGNATDIKSPKIRIFW